MIQQTRRPRAKSHKLAPIEVKTLVRHRDGYRCQECGMTARQHVRKYGKSLDVHRLVPGSDYTVRGCVTLCRKCHENKPKSPWGSQERRTFTVCGKLIPALKKYADRLGISVANVVRLAIVAGLEREGLWPPPPSKS